MNLRSEIGVGNTADRTGVITRWWVASGPASPDTSAVQLRLRVMRNIEPIPQALTPYLPLPLSEPGIHKFPARLPITKGERIGLDVSVLGSGRGVAAAPIGRTVPGVSAITEWRPPLGGIAGVPGHPIEDTRLLLAAKVERDLDDDGWGDDTQDGCRYDPRRHAPCPRDETKPRIEVSYAPRQDFIRRHKLFLRIRTSEYGNVSAFGILGLETHSYGLYGSQAWLPAGASAVFPVYVNGEPLAAAKRYVAAGGHPDVRVSVYAVDASGNQVRRQLRVRWSRG